MSITRGRIALTVLASALFALPSFGAQPDSSPDGLWRSVEARTLPSPEVRVTVYQGVVLDLAEMKRRLASAPMERTAQAVSPQVITLPMPDGSFQRFGAVESVTLEPALAAKFPEIRTYRGQGIDDPAATCALDVTVQGFHAQVLAPSGRVLVDPVLRGDTARYISYYTRDAVATEAFRCFVNDGQPGSYLVTPSATGPRPLAPSGTNLRTYRLALAGTAEYTASVCAPSAAAVACGLSAMTTAMVRVNQVYEQDVAIHMTMVANNDLLVYVANPDPFTNNDGVAMLGENQTNTDSVIGTANYDIGHVFSTGGGGVAYLRVPCRAGWKAQGVTGLPNPVGDAFYIDYVAHEMGHEWGGNHTFNSSSSSCGGGNRSAGAAYEVGSGSTIQSYAGICPPENLQAHSDPYFHVKSFDEIIAYSTGITGGACAVITPTGNNPPTVDAGVAHTIPMQTPFTLTGSATDPESDPLTYCWEEYDLGTQSPPLTDVAASRPIFRSFNPVTSPSRMFPKLSNVLSGLVTIGEYMSTRTRTMTFRLTARDNRVGGGGVNYASTTVAIDATTGPFTVTAPTTGAIWNGGTPATVTWNVAGTTGGTVNCADVNILLSSDGGNTFPTTLVSPTPNDGTQTFTVPTGITTGTARVRVECATNIFFNISRPNFTINPTPLELMEFRAE